MHYLKLAFISFIFLFLLLTGISLFIPSHIRLSKAIRIAAEKDSVLALIRDPVKWKSWYPGADTAKVYFENGVARGLILDDRDTVHPVRLRITGEEADEITAELTGR